MTLRAPAITTQQSTQHGSLNKKVHRVNNYQYSKHVCEKYVKFHCFLQYLTPIEHIMFIISSILTVTEGDSNDIYHVVST